MRNIKIQRLLTSNQSEGLIFTLKARFEKNRNRHKNLEWSQIHLKLEENPTKLWSLHEMERTGGEPDVIEKDERTGEYVFYDCSIESPMQRRKLCYDHDAQESRKGFKPEGNTIDWVNTMDIDLLTEDQYRLLQTFGDFDTKTSSWIKTPSDIRRRGGALFADRRYGCVFVYHNSASSYYSSRGFRGALRV